MVPMKSSKSPLTFSGELKKSLSVLLIVMNPTLYQLGKVIRMLYKFLEEHTLKEGELVNLQYVKKSSKYPIIHYFD